MPRLPIKIARRTQARLLGLLPAAALLAALFVTLPQGPAHAETGCSAEGPLIRVVVEDFRNDKGQVAVSLYNDDADNFMKKIARLDRVRVDVEDGPNVVCLVAPGPGTYAISVYHDENHNRDFDRNFLGIPKEGFGFSRNPKINFGPPDHDEVKFDVDGEDVEIDVSLIYM